MKIICLALVLTFFCHVFVQVGGFEQLCHTVAGGVCRPNKICHRGETGTGKTEKPFRRARWCIGPGLKCCIKIDSGQSRTNGGWSNWSLWSECPVTCGGSIQSRTRKCNNPPPANRGSVCNGDAIERRQCNKKPCPPGRTNGGWSKWSVWSKCPVTCGGSTQSRTRKCNNPIPANGGAVCKGDAIERRQCNNSPCPPGPINGGWSNWSISSPCPVTCGGSTQTRTRKCDNPAPANGGLKCKGDGTETQKCSTNPCPKIDQMCGTGSTKCIKSTEAQTKLTKKVAAASSADKCCDQCLKEGIIKCQFAEFTSKNECMLLIFDSNSSSSPKKNVFNCAAAFGGR